MQVVSHTKKGMRVSARIRKQRIVMRQQYFEEEDIEDPFADNSDVDSNYSLDFKRNHTKSAKRNKKHSRRGRLSGISLDIRRNEQNETAMKLNTLKGVQKVSSQRAQSDHIERNIIAQISKSVKRTRKMHAIPQETIPNNRLIVAPNKETIVHNNSSIPKLNKTELMRGQDGSRVGADSHWLSWDRKFKVGKFLMYKRDKPLLNTTKMSLWRIDNKSMLQKFEAFMDSSRGGYGGINDDEARAIKFRAIKVYAGWSPLHTEEFVLVPVKVDNDDTNEVKGEYLVRIDKSKDIDIDSDE